MTQRHECDAFCVCPVHLAPLLYSPHYGVHACPDPDCVHAHGVIHTIPLAPLLPEIQMAQEMWDASPDGKAEAERIERLIGDLPDATVELETSGRWDGNDAV